MSQGLLSLLEFTGLPVGVPSVAARGRGFRGFGRVILASAMAEAENRSVLDALQARANRLLLANVARRWAEYQTALNASNRTAATALLLAEV